MSYAEDGKRVCLAIVDRQTENMSEGIAITGNGCRLCQSGEALLQADHYMDRMSCTFSEQRLDEVMNIIPYAVLKDYSQDNLKELIWEELEPFFTDQKDADTVCSIIQSRVQLYLDENSRK